MGIASEGEWGKANSALVQLAVNMFVPMVALSSDRSTTHYNCRQHQQRYDPDCGEAGPLTNACPVVIGFRDIWTTPAERLDLLLNLLSSSALPRSYPALARTLLLKTSPFRGRWIPAGTETVLENLAQRNSGRAPAWSDPGLDRFLYCTTEFGGTFGHGVVFKVKP